MRVAGPECVCVWMCVFGCGEGEQREIPVRRAYSEMTGSGETGLEPSASLPAESDALCNLKIFHLNVIFSLFTCGATTQSLWVFYTPGVQICHTLSFLKRERSSLGWNVTFR